MRLSSKIKRCELSPVRKFYPYEMAAVAKGLKVRHLNIGQPDIETPKAFFDAVNDFGEAVLEYAPAPGVEVCGRGSEVLRKTGLPCCER